MAKIKLRAFPTFVLRTPLFPLSALDDPERTMQQPCFREALYLASPDLYTFTGDKTEDAEEKEMCIRDRGVIAQSTRSTLGDDNWVEWDANDSFSVFSSMSFSSEFTIKELLDEGHGAKLEGMTIPADTYYILYPYIMDAMIAEGKIRCV